LQKTAKIFQRSKKSGKIIASNAGSVTRPRPVGESGRSEKGLRETGGHTR